MGRFDRNCASNLLTDGCIAELALECFSLRKNLETVTNSKRAYEKALDNNSKVVSELHSEMNRLEAEINTARIEAFAAGVRKGAGASVGDFFKLSGIWSDGSVTIYYWEDGNKTVLKLAPGERPDAYNAFCIAMAKKLYGSNTKIHELINEGMKNGKP